MRTIRRYSNRKLYDTQDSHYVTLAQIATIIRAGEEILVTNKDSGKDLTAATMAQIIFEETKKGQALPIPGLRKITLHAPPAVGSTRELEDNDGLVLNERITALDPGHWKAAAPSAKRITLRQS